MPSATLAAPVLLAAVLALSGAAKLREPAATASAFRQLRLPGWLVSSGAPRVLPWAELGLVAGLLLLPGSAYLVAAVLAALLVLAYLAVVLRALGFDEPVTCSCFGRIGVGPLGPVTVARNVLLVLLAAVGVLDASGGEAVASRLGEAGGWPLMVLAAGALGMLVAHRGEEPGAATGASVARALDAAGAGHAGLGHAGHGHATHSADHEPVDAREYVRTPMPRILLNRADGGSTTLHDLVLERPALLVCLSMGCGGCQRVLADLPGFLAATPELGSFLVLSRDDVDAYADRVPPGMGLLVDEAHAYSRHFGHRTPGAVLLGADQLLAGGPVHGERDVQRMLAEIREELAEVRRLTDPS